MKRNYIGIYALAVCFISAVVFSVAVGKGIYNLLEISMPQFTLSEWDYKRLQSNANFIQNWHPERKIPDDETLTQMREEDYKVSLEAEKRAGWQGIINSLITVLVTSVFFLIHWIIAKRNQVRSTTQ